MDLNNARLCLDCEKLHILNDCPRCASRTWAPITPWIQPWLSKGKQVLDIYPGSPRDTAAGKHYREVGE